MCKLSSIKLSMYLSPYKKDLCLFHLCADAIQKEAKVKVGRYPLGCKVLKIALQHYLLLLRLT